MIKKNVKKPDWTLGAVCVVIFYMTYFVTDKLMSRGADLNTGDFFIHTNNAALLEFSNPLPFLKRFTYPVYHVLTALINRIFNISLYEAGIFVAACFSVFTVIVTYKILHFFLEDYGSKVIGGLTFALSVVTSIYWPWYNKQVYAGQSSPNIWHSPTQVVVKAAALLIIFLFVKYYNEFQIELKSDGKGKWLSWKKISILSVLLLYTVLAKPSFLQGFLPAVMLFLLIELWVTKGMIMRFCIQAGIAFIPSCLYLLYQFLFYYSAGSEHNRGGIKFTFFGFVDNSAPNILISSILLYAFPIFVLIFISGKEIFKDKYLWLIFLFAVVAFCESACLAEAVSNAAGNFSWAKQLSVYFLWVIAIIKFLQKKKMYPELEMRGKNLLFATGDILIVAHLVSGIYYYIYLIASPVLA